jgi:gamma-carbonic anhydrase
VLIEHEGRRPAVHPTAWIAPTAVVSGVVHVNTVLEAGGLVPIAWVAVGDPAPVPPRERHDDSCAIPETLDFPGTAFGPPRDTPDLAVAATRRHVEVFGLHRGDRVLAEE